MCIMARLNRRIETGIDYRPCIVHIPGTVKEITANSGGRALRISNDREVEGLFHCWMYRSELVRGVFLRDVHLGEQITETFALVEYEDGTMHEVEPKNIRFVDGRINQYGFWEEENVGKCED